MSFAKTLLNNKTFILILVSALLFRIILIPVARHGDVNNNTSWGEALLDRGTVNFYEGTNWKYSAPNQPPLYVAVFGVTSFIERAVNNAIHWLNAHVSVFPSKIVWRVETWGQLYISKLPGIFADLGIAAVIYRLFKNKRKIGLLLSTLWLFNPASWYVSAIWGGTDSIVNLLGIISIALLLKKKLNAGAIFIVISFLFKGSLLLFAPLWLLIALKQRFSQKTWLKALFLSFGIILLCLLPFHPQIDVSIWFFNLYTKSFIPGEIGSLTANAFNMWWLVDSGKTLDSALFLGIPARIWGWGLTLLGYSYLLWKNYKKASRELSIFSFALIAFLSFLFMTRIHERYLYPFFPLATISLGFMQWLLIPYVVLSITYLLNLYHLFWAPGIELVKNWYLNPSFMIILSIINLLIFGYLLFKISDKKIS